METSVAKPKLVRSNRSAQPGHVPTINTPCFCGTFNAFLEDPLRDEIYCRMCGFRLTRSTILEGPVAMRAEFVQFRAQVLEAGRIKADPMGLLPGHYRRMG